MVTLARFLLAALLGLSALACEPDLDDRTSIVDAPRFLAIRSTPAEAAPGDPVRYEALFVDETGVPEASIDWDFCIDRKPLAELGPVAARCFTPEASLVEIGSGASVEAQLAVDSCRRFGPEVPEPEPGEPAGRPVDPDVTGGFHVPVRAAAAEALALGATRVRCTPAGLVAEVLADYNSRYARNENPGLEAVGILEGETLRPFSGDEGANVVAPGQRVVLRAAWPTCDEAPCAGAEPYVAIDPETRRVAERREGIRVAWFATAGAFDDDRTGRGAADPLVTSDNGWVAPSAPGSVHLWVVIRDDRGGVGWSSHVIDVR